MKLKYILISSLMGLLFSCSSNDSLPAFSLLDNELEATI